MPDTFFHIGIYTIADASRLTGLGESRVRRWLSGYSFKAAGGTRRAPPVWSGQLPPLQGRRVVSFRDLIEMKFVDAFLRAGVSWQVIRRVQDLARRQFNYDHPFSTNRFRTDGSHLVMTAAEDERQGNLFDLSTRQQIFLAAGEPFREELDVNHDDTVSRWWPLGRGRGVVLDPARGWGRPILARSGLPTAVVRLARKGFRDPAALCGWYGIAEQEFRDALDFEAKLEEAE